MRFIIKGHHRHRAIGSGAIPRHAEGISGARHLQHHIRAAVVRICQRKCLADFGGAGQHRRIMGPDEGNSCRVLFADNDPLRFFQQHAHQRTQSCRTGADDQNGVLFPNLADPGSPEAGGQNIPHQKRLLVGDRIGNFIQSLIGIGYTHIFRLSPIDPAPQGPAAIGIGAVVYKAFFAEEAFAAEGLHIHRHPITGTDGGHRFSHRLHHTHHLMSHGDAGYCFWHRTMLDMQIAGADAAQCHPDDGISGVQNLRFFFFGQSKFPLLDVG